MVSPRCSQILVFVGIVSSVRKTSTGLWTQCSRHRVLLIHPLLDTVDGPMGPFGGMPQYFGGAWLLWSSSTAPSFDPMDLRCTHADLRPPLMDLGLPKQSRWGGPVPSEDENEGLHGSCLPGHSPWIRPQIPGHVRTFFYLSYFISEFRAQLLLVVSIIMLVMLLTLQLESGVDQVDPAYVCHKLYITSVTLVDCQQRSMQVRPSLDAELFTSEYTEQAYGMFGFHHLLAHFFFSWHVLRYQVLQSLSLSHSALAPRVYLELL